MSVYFAEKDGLIKIGYSADPTQRAKTLRARLLGVMPGGRRMERVMHSTFDAYRSHGEWFNPGVRLVVFVEALGCDGFRIEGLPDAYQRAEAGAMATAFYARCASAEALDRPVVVFA
jgi:hypothetical protein